MVRAPVGETLTRSQLYILEAISKGHQDERLLRHALGASKATIQQATDELEAMGLIQKDGLFRRRYRLTSGGINSLVADGRQSALISANQLGQSDKKEIKVTSTLGTGFKLAFGVIMGVFMAWLVIGVVASIIYWLTYQLLIRHYVPTTLLAYVPLENLWINVLLGLATATVLFLPLRKRIKLTKN